MTMWLVTGAAGFLGSNIGAYLAGRTPFIGLARQNIKTRLYPQTFTIDLRKFKALEELVRDQRPAVILHAAAIAGHETAANDPQQAFDVNVTATQILANIASDIGARMIFISTDALYSGTKGNYSETEPVEPFSVYGETKYKGEEAVRASTENHLIVRTNFFGWSETGRKSILEFFVNSLRDGIAVPGYADFIVTSIYVQSLVQAIWDLTELGATGTMNVVSNDARSKYEFGRQVAQTFGLPIELITSLPSEGHNHVTSRSRNLSLSTEKVEQLLNHRLPTQAEGITAAARDEDKLIPRIRRPASFS